MRRTPLDWLVVVVPPLLFVAASLRYGLVDYPILRDHSFYAYFGFRAAAGDVAYRDFFDNKTPLSMYITAGLIRLAELAGADRVTAFRVGYLVMSALVVALAVMILQAAFFDRRLSLLGGLVLGTFGLLSRFAISGPEPKVPMLLFALLATLTAQQGRWFLSGMATGLSGLAWQPGWSFGAVGLIAIAATPTRRVRAIAWLLAGVTVPIILAAIYFAWHGALRDFLWQTIIINRVHAPRGAATTWLAKVSRIAFLVGAMYHREMLIVAVGALGVVAFAWESRAGLALRTASRETVAFGTAALLPILFTVVLGVQGATDVLVLAPSIAFFAAYLLVRVIQARPAAAWAFAAVALALALLTFWGQSNRPLVVGVTVALAALWAFAFWPRGTAARAQQGQLSGVTVAVVGLALLAYGFVDVARFDLPFTRRDQERTFHALAARAGLDSKSEVLTLWAAEFLVLTDRRNALRYVHFYIVTPRFYEAYERRPFGTLIADLEQAAPKLVLIREARPGPATELVRQWVAAHYRREPPLVEVFPEDPEGATVIEVWSRP